jgi:hypothetical protein
MTRTSSFASSNRGTTWKAIFPVGVVMTDHASNLSAPEGAQ